MVGPSLENSPRRPVTLENLKQDLISEGICFVPDVLDRASVTEVRTALTRSAKLSEQRGQPTYIPALDPNPANVRVFNLIDLDPVFRDLIGHPVALSLVRQLLGEHFMISNFTANIARPGSLSMAIHSDQAIVIPEPWENPWAINIIWCLDDMTAANGGTLYLPASHNIRRLSELPNNMKAKMVPLEAKAGSIIAMDGRIWHTSGPNVTADQERALLFGYYTMDFIRPQVNWNATLSQQTIEQLPPALFARLGLGPGGNTRQGSSLTVVK